MKFVFDANQVMTASMLLNISTKTLLDKVNVETLNKVERNRLLAHNTEAVEHDYEDFIGCRVIYAAKSDTVFVYKPRQDDILIDGTGLLILAYAVLYTRSFSSLEDAMSRYREHQVNVSTAKDYLMKIRNYETKVNELFARSFGGIRFLSIDDFMSACKKQKVKCEYKDGYFNLTFKKVRVGNELEGWINYKSITVRINHTLNIVSTKFEFNSFFIDTAWNIYSVPVMHPHINASSSFCFGNRKTDFELYKRTYSYAFYIDLIRETVHSFSADSPFAHVNQIASSISILEDRLGLAHIQDEQGNLISAEKNPELFSRRFLIHMGNLTCPHCGSYSHVDAQGRVTGCSNLSCAANPVAHRTCRNCGTTLERGEWSIDRSLYEWNCRNRQCRYYVADPAEAAAIRARLSPGGEGIRCMVCGEKMFNEHRYLSSENNYLECANDNCNVRGLHQYTLLGIVAPTHGIGTFRVEAIKYAISNLNRLQEAREYIMDVHIPSKYPAVPSITRRDLFNVSYNTVSQVLRGSISGTWYTVGTEKEIYDLYRKFFTSEENLQTVETIKQYLISKGVTLDES